MSESRLSRLTRKLSTLLMGLSVFVPPASPDSARAAPFPDRLTIPERVAIVREHIQRAEPTSRGAPTGDEPPGAPGERAEERVSQWYNWPNWPNWPNWRDWGNWNNWRDWGNWRNWRNY